MKETEALITLESVQTLVESVDIPALIAKWDNVPTLNPEEGLRAENYLEVKRGHLDFVSARNKIEKVRKHLKQPAIEYGREVDGKAREYKNMMADKEDQLFIQRRKVEDYEAEQKQVLLDKEKARVDAINVAIFELQNLPTANIGNSAAQLLETYEGVAIPEDDIFQERMDEALHIYSGTMHKLETMLDTATKAEEAEKLIAKEQERAAEIQAKADEAAAKEREIFEAEKKELAEEKAEFNRKMNKEEEDRRKKKAEEEAQKLQDEQEAQGKRMAEDAHQAKERAITSMSEVINLWRSSTSQEIAENIYKAIKEGKIEGVKI